MFKLTYIGHAGWLVENKDFRCAFDPWSPDSGAFFDQWYPFPDNSALDFNEILKDLDFLYISHAHEDHFSKHTLLSVDRQTPVLIPKFRDKTLLSGLKDMGFKDIKQLDPHEDIEVKGVFVRIIKDEGYLDNDSCILLDDGENKILNLNDCHIDFTKLKNSIGNVDVLLLQSSSALWWPCVYDYKLEIMESHGSNKRYNILQRSLKYAQSLNARITIPNAGPPVFASAHLDNWNYNRRKDWNPFCLADDSCEFLKSHGIESEFMIPSEELCVSVELSIKKDIVTRKRIYSNVEGYMQSYLDSLRQKKEPKRTYTNNERLAAANKFKAQIQKISTISKFYKEKINFPFVFVIDGVCDYLVDFSKTPVVSEIDNHDVEYSYLFEIDSDSMVEIMSNSSMDFESYFLGCNFKCSRTPDVYNEFLFALLRHFDTKRFLISEELYSQNNKSLDELFILHHNDDTYEVQKYCPHMFADLEEVGYMNEEGQFVCPLHGWKFSSQTGECTNKKNYCLKIRKVEK